MVKFKVQLLHIHLIWMLNYAQHIGLNDIDIEIKSNIFTLG